MAPGPFLIYSEAPYVPMQRMGFVELDQLVECNSLPLESEDPDLPWQIEVSTISTTELIPTDSEVIVQECPIETTSRCIPLSAPILGIGIANFHSLEITHHVEVMDVQTIPPSQALRYANLRRPDKW